MKKNGILNSDISKVLSDLGHTDQITIGDCGLPIPDGVKKIDLALKLGYPTFKDVLMTVLDDMAVEKIVLAEEIIESNKKLYEEINRYAEAKNWEVELVSHTKFKKQTQVSKAIIRTGECTPFANIILQSAVIF